METNKIYLGNAYELIKQVEDKSIDLIYTDIPYLFVSGGGGGLMKADSRKKLYNEDIKKFRDGINYSILDEFVRVLKHIYIYMVQ